MLSMSGQKNKYSQHKLLKRIKNNPTKNNIPTPAKTKKHNLKHVAVH